MGDVLGLLLSVLHVTKNVVIYLKDARACDKDMKAMMVEVCCASGMVQSLAELAKVDDSWVRTIETLASDKGPLHQANDILRELESKLKPRQGLRMIVTSAVWPWKKGDAVLMLRTMQRLNSVFSLALQCDHIELSRAIRDDVGAIQKMLEKIYDTHTAKQHAAILDWLSTTNPTLNHLAACAEHQPGTGNWLLESASFKRWLDGQISFLWIQGISGSGKTVMSSTLIDTVSSWCDMPHTPRSCLGYFYFDFNDESKQSPLGALRSVIRQISRAKDLPTCVLDMFAIFDDRGKPPSLEQFVQLLLSISGLYERTFIIMDALDESKELEELAKIFENILRNQKGSISILVTSRKERAIEKALETLPAELIPMDSEAIDADIRLYISERLANDNRLRIHLPGIKREIEKTLAEKSQGMFRWVACQLDALRQCLNLVSLRKALKSLPTTLDDIYQQILSRIPDHSRLVAVIALQWLAFSARPLSIREIAEAVAVGAEQNDSDEDLALEDYRFFTPEDVLIVCSSLVTYSMRTLEVRLAHHSVKEYLVSDRLRNRPLVGIFQVQCGAANGLIARASLRYLLACTEDVKDRLQTVAEKFPLFEYAAKFWPSHLQVVQDGKSDSGASELSARLLCGSLQPKDGAAFNNWLFTAHPDLPWTSSTGDGVVIGTPLYYACLLELVYTAKLLLSRGCDPNGTGQYGSCLNVATLRNNEELVRILIKARADVNTAGRGGTQTPMGRAAKSGSVAVMKLLIHAGAEVECRDSSGGTPLHVAAGLGHKELVKLLLNKGANIKAQNNSGQRPLQVATASGRTPVVNLLVSKGADIAERFARHATLLHCVSSAETASRLIELGVPVDAEDDDGYTALHVACRGHCPEVVKVLLLHGAFVNARSTRRETPLLLASINQDEEVAKLLVETGADVNAQSRFGKTPLDNAKEPWGAAGNTAEDRRSLVAFLESKGAHRGIRRPPTGSIPASNNLVSLINSLTWSRDTIVPRLKDLMRQGTDIDGRSPQWNNGTALHYCAQFVHGSVSVEQNPLICLLENGADVNALDGEGHPPLIVAILYNRPENVLAILKHRANANFVCSHHHAPLHIAARVSPDAFRHLLAYGADPNILVPSGRSVLHVAAWEAQFELVRLLLKSRANVNALDDSNGTPLHEVVCFRGVNRRPDDYVETLRVLLDAGLDPEARMFNGTTPLFRACYNGNLGMVKLLLERGADPNAELAYKAEGSNLVEVSLTQRHKEVADFLKGLSKAKQKVLVL